MPTQCLLLSNSSFSTSQYLAPWKAAIEFFFKSRNSGKNILFVPYAVITLPWNDYLSKVTAGLPELTIKSIHSEEDPMKAVNDADGFIIGGGNTFNLLYHLATNKVLDAIAKKVTSGTPYVGWSAGSNVATPDIGTTNDMPVIWPPCYTALNLVPFNINPHYTTVKPPGGESRDDRLNEAASAAKRRIVALAEGTGILVDDSTYTIVKAPGDLVPPGHVYQVKVWKSTDDSYTVTEVQLNDESGTPLNPYL